jgi:hypothetical protein
MGANPNRDAESSRLVVLSAPEMYVAGLVANLRQIAALTKGSVDRFGAENGDPWTLHRLGAFGELAVAKHLGIYWPASVNAAKNEPDLPPDIQVRTRGHLFHDLIVRDDDRDDHRYVLVTGQAPNFMVHGYIYGYEARVPTWRLDRGGRGAPCYWVPQSALHRFDRTPTEAFA